MPRSAIVRYNSAKTTAHKRKREMPLSTGESTSKHKDGMETEKDDGPEEAESTKNGQDRARCKMRVDCLFALYSRDRVLVGSLLGS